MFAICLLQAQNFAPSAAGLKEALENHFGPAPGGGQQSEDIPSEKSIGQVLPSAFMRGFNSTGPVASVAARMTSAFAGPAASGAEGGHRQPTGAQTLDSGVSKLTW